MRVKHVWNIPSGLPFSRVLAGALLAETAVQKEDLGRLLVFLPTRRACRVLQEAFLKGSGSDALLLPKMQPIGDLDEEMISLSALGLENTEVFAHIPPPLSRVKREVLLGTAIQKLYPAYSLDQALLLARALGHLMDQIYTENLDLGRLVHLVPEDFAEHWQITIGFLEILSVKWPEILAEEGRIDYADARNRKIQALCGIWQENPPPYPVIAAGSTGSIPATAGLLDVIAGLEKGRVILPGLDQDLDSESWEALLETHPQYGFKILLERMGLSRTAVRNMTEESVSCPVLPARRTLVREMMRPSETVYCWERLLDNTEQKALLSKACENVSLLVCDHPRQEAETIAIILRECIEHKDRTACFITPDRMLARRVSIACERWGITLDDSAGNSLDKMAAGTFLLLALGVIVHDVAPVSLLAFLKHEYCACERADVETLDEALRGIRPAKGFDGLIGHVESLEKFPPLKRQAAVDFLKEVKRSFAPLTALDFSTDHSVALSESMKAHVRVCEQFAQGKDPSENNGLLWRGPAGQALSSFLSEIMQETGLLMLSSVAEYHKTLAHFMSHTAVRPAYGTHPRVQILGQLEARLIDADLVILGGLNEGTWPPDPAEDPWMSRPMRAQFGLPSLERSTGLSAHDFVQGFCNKNVVLTRARENQGVLTVPARWLLRLEAVMKAAGLSQEQLSGASSALYWAKSRYNPERIRLVDRPAPCPPVNTRPRKLSVTKIETWMKDPYGIYAGVILGLKKWKELESPVDSAEKGSLIHKILERFVEEYREHWPDNPEKILHDIAREELEKRHEDPAVWYFWWAQFSRFVSWFVTHEMQWRKRAHTLAVEIKGTLTLQTHTLPFLLEGRVDRLDRFHAAGGAIVIDYKSGGTFSEKHMKTGHSPQLPLEALMVSQGGFEHWGPLPVQALQYWLLYGRDEKKNIVGLEEGLEDLLEKTRAGLMALIEAFDDPAMPYYSVPRIEHAPRFNDYAHLARIKEWGLQEEDGAQEVFE